MYMLFVNVHVYPSPLQVTNSWSELTVYRCPDGSQSMEELAAWERRLAASPQAGAAKHPFHSILSSPITGNDDGSKEPLLYMCVDTCLRACAQGENFP
jgi:hypothetical protein